MITTSRIICIIHETSSSSMCCVPVLGRVWDFAKDHWFWLLKNCRIEEPLVLVF
jgi:hypothetical protein